jgi:hypothetical protein
MKHFHRWGVRPYCGEVLLAARPPVPCTSGDWIARLAGEGVGGGRCVMQEGGTAWTSTTIREWRIVKERRGCRLVYGGGVDTYGGGVDTSCVDGGID